MKLTKPRGVKPNETVAEWYERITKGGNPSVQRLGNLQDQSTATINGVPRASNE